MLEHQILARLNRIEQAIQLGSLTLREFTAAFHHLSNRIDTMSAESDAFNAQLAALVSEAQAAVTKLGEAGGDRQALVDGTNKLKEVADQLHAAANPA